MRAATVGVAATVGQGRAGWCGPSERRMCIGMAHRREKRAWLRRDDVKTLPMSVRDADVLCVLGARWR